MSNLESLIRGAWEDRAALSPSNVDPELRGGIDECLHGLETGAFRVAEPTDDGWRVNEWLKQAILLHFRVTANRDMPGGASHFFDKVDLRFADASDAPADSGARVVPTAIVRRGAHIGQDVVLMPSYVNIGAYVGEGSMIDTWATVGSCAQIGSGVHISGGAGIGGVLEPLQANPTIIEDGCFIGARSEVVEGRDRREGRRDRYGRLHRPVDAHLRPRHRRDHHRARAGRLGGRGRQPACRRRHPQPLCGHHRQAGG
jgi:2,3,4,5-tetrahydropyridine-2-carboxylate N-succinyltransferase